MALSNEQLEKAVYILGGVLGGVSVILLCAVIGAYCWLSNINKQLKNKPNPTIDKQIPRASLPPPRMQLDNSSRSRNQGPRRDDYYGGDYYNNNDASSRFEAPPPPPPAMPYQNPSRNPVTRNPLNDRGNGNVNLGYRGGY